MMRFALIFLSVVFVFPVYAHAQGLLDFLDPCIGAKRAYWQERGTLVENYAFQLEAVSSAQPTDRFRAWWWEEKRASLVPYYEREILPILIQSGARDKVSAFNAWMEMQIRDAGGRAKLEELMTAEYRRLRHLVLSKQRGETFAQLDAERQSLYGSCPEDVANQVFRGAQVIVGGAVGVVNRNIELSRRESGEIAKSVAATTGISLQDIQNRGPLGGDNSEARKVCNGIASVWGGSC